MHASTPTAASPRRRRRRLPQHVYWRRRIVVLLAVGLIGWAGIAAVGGLLDDDGSGALRSASPTAETLVPSAPTDESETAPAAEGAADSDAEGIVGEGAAAGEDVGDAAAADAADDADDADDSDEDLPPSTENPASVHIVGDSDAGTFGPYLQTLLDNTLIVDTSLDYKVSSGLARPDFFDWPDQLRTTIPEVDPDIVVVTFGGNDSQGLSKPQDDLEFIVGDPLDNEAEWSAEYERRVLEVIDILLEDGREVIWVGSPNDNNPDVTAKLRIQDQAVRAAIAQRPEVVFVDTWTRFSGRDGNWAEFVVDPRDGVGKDVRADDGYHLNTTGAEILAIDIAVEVRDLLRDAGADI